MIIEIPEDCTNRIEFIKLYLAKHALDNYPDRKTQSSFIGIHIRTLSKWFNFYPELSQYRKDIARLEGNEKWDQYEDDDIRWKTKHNIFEGEF